MKNRAGLISLILPILLAYSCGKDSSSDKPEPVDTVASPAPVVPNMPKKPDPSSVPPADTANNSELKLAPLPDTGVPEGYLSWDEFNTIDPESRSLLIFDGTDPAAELLGEGPLCSVYVLAAYLKENSQPTYVLRTSFKHNKQSHAWISLSFEKDNPRMTGNGSNGQDQIFLQLAQPGDMLSVTRMNLKWFHINHFDTGVCENLKLRPQL